MERKFSVEYENTPFLGTSKTAAHPNRLNWRCEILLTRNQVAIRGKRILDLASHDGRFSYACLELGASHVAGVEGRQHLVESAKENLVGLGYKPEQFSFLHGDVFDYLHKVKPGEFDTILCFGFFYHTVRQNELLREINRIKPGCFILDTYVARGIFSANPVGSKFTRAKLTCFVRISITLKRLAQQIASPDKGEPCLVFSPESHVIEAATIDQIDLVAWPTKTYIEQALRNYGFRFKQLKWNRADITDWTAIEDYRTGDRVSYLAERSNS